MRRALTRVAALALLLEAAGFVPAGGRQLAIVRRQHCCPRMGAEQNGSGKSLWSQAIAWHLAKKQDEGVKVNLEAAGAAPGGGAAGTYRQLRWITQRIGQVRV
jgi:hypothetical protein